MHNIVHLSSFHSILTIQHGWLQKCFPSCIRGFNSTKNEDAINQKNGLVMALRIWCETPRTPTCKANCSSRIKPQTLKAKLET